MITMVRRRQHAVKSRTPAGNAWSEFVVLVFQLNGRLAGAGDELAQAAGQTSARWLVLAAVERAPASVADIARVLNLTRQSVQRVADVLEQDGLAKYQENPAHRRAKLPVDAFYPELKLVFEYRERQHTESVTFWDTKLTACGLQRGEQRKQYDQIRRVVLKDRGYDLVEIDFFDLAHDARKRLIRDISKDKVSIRAKLAKFLGT